VYRVQTLKKKIFSTTVTVRLTNDMLAMIESYAKKHRVTRSEAIRRLLMKALGIEREA
jgi:Ribbon-helix-helix protein, copG family.